MQANNNAETARSREIEPGAWRGAGGNACASFTTTHWSTVLSAGHGGTDTAAEALEKLCSAYWYPLYVFIRRKGYEPHAAQDLTQGFFARLLEKNYLHGIDRAKGKFRSFLLAALEHYLANEWRRSQAEKRGGKVAFISLDDQSAEQKYLQIPGSEISAEKLFERQWATTLLEQVLARLRGEFVGAGKERLFEEIKIFLTGERRAISYAELASKLGTREAALKMAVSRMKQRYGELLRSEIAQIVSKPEEIEDELRALLAALTN